MSGTTIRTLIRNYLLIIIGTALVAFATASVLEPASLVTGGFTGIAIIVKQFTEHLVPGGVPLSVTNLVLNIPVFLIAIRLKGLRYLIHTLFATVMLSFWLSVLPVVPLAGDDLLLASLYGGILMGSRPWCSISCAITAFPISCGSSTPLSSWWACTCTASRSPCTRSSPST